MRIRYGCVFLLCLIIFSSVRVYAKDYTDNMSDATGDSVKTYYGLAPGKSGLTFSSTGHCTASARYRVSGAQTVCVEIRTYIGTFVHQSGGAYVMGGLMQKPDGAARALFSPSARAIYFSPGSGRYEKLFYDDTGYRFVADTNPGDLISYGVNVYAGADGSDPVDLSLRHVSAVFDASGSFCTEQFIGTVPARADRIIVEINDIQEIPTTSGSAIPMTAQKRTRLLSVSLSGENLSIGASPPDESGHSQESLPGSSALPSGSGSNTESDLLPESVSPDSVSLPDGSTGSGLWIFYYGTSSSRTSGSSSSKTSSSSSKVSSSKFEGSIVKSSSQAKSKAATSQAASPRTSLSASSASTASSKFSPADETADRSAILSATEVVQYVTSPSEESTGGTFGIAVTVYIVIVCAGILFIVLRGKSGK